MDKLKRIAKAMILIEDLALDLSNEDYEKMLLGSADHVKDAYRMFREIITTRSKSDETLMRENKKLREEIESLRAFHRIKERQED